MKYNKPVLSLVLSGCLFFSFQNFDNLWITEKHKSFNLVYTAGDRKLKKEYTRFTENGIKEVKNFFSNSFNKKFEVYIHPGRRSLDSTWQKDWKMPDFKSECWMVASGVAARLDLLSPTMWGKEACEHIYSEKDKTQKLITHELIHVFHGQQNASPDFSNTEGIDWFAEGLATYVSGQCDSSRISEIKKAITANKIPDGLDKFWTGKLKYGLSGSVVMYIDYKFGRTKLKELLPYNKKSEILSSLNTTEGELLAGWEKYMRSL